MSNVFQRIVSMMKTSFQQNSPEADSNIGAHRAIQVVFMWNLFGDDLLNLRLRGVPCWQQQRRKRPSDKHEAISDNRV